jgi:hypothetical protein
MTSPDNPGGIANPNFRFFFLLSFHYFQLFRFFLSRLATREMILRPIVCARGHRAEAALRKTLRFHAEGMVKPRSVVFPG